MQKLCVLVVLLGFLVFSSGCKGSISSPSGGGAVSPTPAAVSASVAPVRYFVCYTVIKTGEVERLEGPYPQETASSIAVSYNRAKNQNLQVKLVATTAPESEGCKASLPVKEAQ